MFFSLPASGGLVFLTVCNENGTKKKVFIPSSRLTDGEKNHPCLFCSFWSGLEHNIVYSSHNILDNVKIYVRPANGIFVVNLAFYLLMEKLIFLLSVPFYKLIWMLPYGCTTTYCPYGISIGDITDVVPPPILDMPSSKIALNTFSSSNCKIPLFFFYFSSIFYPFFHIIVQ